MRGPADDVAFEAWLADAYHNRPAPRHDVARELFEEEMAHRATERQKAWQRGEVAALARRVRALERMLLGADGQPGGPLLRATGDLLATLIARERKSTGERIDEQIDAALTAKCPLSFKGTHDTETGYLRGDVTVHNGSLWVCLSDTSGREPPNKSACWRLCVKSPDGRPPVIA